MIRLATVDDIPHIEKLTAESCLVLLKNDFPQSVIEHCLATVWKLDRDLIDDRTYYVIIEDDMIVGCGGWSKRKKIGAQVSLMLKVIQTFISRVKQIRLK